MKNTALVRWVTTHKKESVDLKDLQKFSIEETCSRKQKSKDFYKPSLDRKIASAEQCDHDVSAPEGCIDNIFFLRTTLISFVLKVRYKT